LDVVWAHLVGPVAGGWAEVILGIVLIVVGLAMSVGMHGTMH